MAPPPTRTALTRGASAATEGALLDAALAEVIAHGIRRTTASDVARRAGVSRQTLYRYWPDVQALFASLVTRELLAVLPGETEPEDLDDLVGLLVGTASAVRRMPLLGRLRDTDPELLGRYLLTRLGTSQRAIHTDLSRRLRAAQDRGLVRGGDADALAATVMLLVQSAVLSGPLVEEWLPATAWTDELSRALKGYLG
ncbi:TetR/AcrR family transcriptional regulator [Microbacterium sp. BK668]|uniref:TetR/AcrR family transcriptional regulator n=1 Tax=Microbacterium sp. BK668 TaxID=2512118 RepID=UPI00105C802A|nr:TetR/AcrR family transcriptional regulator [Microbacterium sp. BK668]TDN88449.1 TetR family transcriptional regulator [Microbacterium sp. BK668]